MTREKIELSTIQLNELSKISVTNLVSYISDTITSAASVSQSTWDIRHNDVLCEIEPLEIFEHAFERLRSELIFRSSDEGRKESSFDRICRVSE